MNHKIQPNHTFAAKNAKDAKKPEDAVGYVEGERG